MKSLCNLWWINCRVRSAIKRGICNLKQCSLWLFRCSKIWKLLTQLLQTLTPLTIQLIPYLLNMYSLETMSFDPSNSFRYVSIYFSGLRYQQLIHVCSINAHFLSYSDSCIDDAQLSRGLRIVSSEVSFRPDNSIYSWRKKEKKVSTASVSPQHRRISTYLSTLWHNQIRLWLFCSQIKNNNYFSC